METYQPDKRSVFMKKHLCSPKKILALILSFVMIIGCIPMFTVGAAFVPDSMELDYTLGAGTYTNGQYANTGYLLNWDRDFELDITFRVSSVGSRYVIVGGYDNSSTRELNIELSDTSAGAVRVYFGKGEFEQHSTARVAANDTVTMKFNWHASSDSYTLTAKGASTDISMSGTYPGGLSGCAVEPLFIGASDHRSGSSPFGTIYIASAAFYMQHEVTDTPKTVIYDYNRTLDFAAGEYTDTGYYINWSRSFSLEQTFRVTQLGHRYLMFGAYDNKNANALNLEVNENNTFRVYVGAGQQYYDENSTAVIAANDNIRVRFTWFAGTNTYALTAKGSQTDITMTGSIPATLASGVAGQPLRMGTADHRGYCEFYPLAVSDIRICEYDYADFMAGDYYDSGCIINWDRDFTIRALFRVPTANVRNVICAGYDNSSNNELNIEIESNKIRVYFGVNKGDHHSTGTVATGKDVDMLFTWTAASKSWSVRAVGSGTDISMSGTADMSGSAVNTLRLGARDYRPGETGPFMDIKLTGFIFDGDPVAAGTAASITPAAYNGYAFSEWTAKENSSGTFCAKWTPIEYTLTFDANGGDALDPIGYTAESAGSLPLPVRKGYDFTSWQVTTAGGSWVKDQTFASGTALLNKYGSATLKAGWAVRGDTPYTVNHYYMNADGSYPETPETQSFTGTTEAVVTAAQKASVPEHFTLDTQKSDASVTVLGDGSSVLNLYYARDTYTVTFTLNGELLDTQTVRYGAMPTSPVKPEKLPDATYHYSEGYWEPAIAEAAQTAEYKLLYNATAHSGGTATCTAQAVCSVCGTSYGELLPHTGMEDFICDECGYYDEAAALADAKVKAIAAIEATVSDDAPYGVAVIAEYAITRIGNADSIDAVNAEKEAALSTIDAIVNDKSEALAEAEMALAEAQTALSEAQTQIDSLTAALAEKETALTEANADLTAAETAKAALETQLAEKEIALAALQDTVDADADEIAALEADIDELEAAITEKDEVITAKSNEITALEATVAANETAIAAAETQISTLTSDLTAAQTQVDTLTAALAEAQTALAAKDAALAEATANLATANAALTTANAQISSLTDDIDEMSAALTLAEGNLITANTALAAAETQIDGLTDDLAAANAALAAKETALAEANAALAAAQNEKTALETQLAELKDNLDADENEIASLEAAIAEKDGIIADKTNEINTLKAGAAAYKTAIAEAEKEIADKDAEIASLKTRLNKALDDIEALKEGTYVEPEDDGTCRYCGKEHKNVFDKFFCMVIRFFDFLISVFEFSSAT